MIAMTIGNEGTNKTIKINGKLIKHQTNRQQVIKRQQHRIFNSLAERSFR